LSTKVEDLLQQNGEFYSVHRTFPGTLKDIPNYNASARSWFTRAPVDHYYLGAYKETFTHKNVINLSTKKIVESVSDSHQITVVSAALMLLEEVQSVVYNINYSNDGFGALVKYDTMEVLCWKQVEIVRIVNITVLIFCSKRDSKYNSTITCNVFNFFPKLILRLGLWKHIF